MCDPINRNIGYRIEILNVLKTWQVIDGCKSNNELQCIEWVDLSIEYSSSFFSIRYSSNWFLGFKHLIQRF